MIRLAVAGAGGRMGRHVLAAALADPELAVVGGIVRGGSPFAGQDLGVLAGTGPVGVEASEEALTDAVLSRAQLLIDFSWAAATVAYARAAAAHGCAFLTGTTGLTPEQLAAVKEGAGQVPTLIAANTSVGLTALLGLLPALVRALGPDYDLEIVETHHRHKADAPSGTALTIAGILAGARDETVAAPEGAGDRATFGRHGHSPRRPGEIGVHAVRAGGSPGEHRVILASEGEQVEIVHRVTSRQTYAAGALRAARWLVHQPPGLYSMTDVVTTA